MKIVDAGMPSHIHQPYTVGCWSQLSPNFQKKPLLTTCHPPLSVHTLRLVRQAAACPSSSASWPVGRKETQQHKQQAPSVRLPEPAKAICNHTAHRPEPAETFRTGLPAKLTPQAKLSNSIVSLKGWLPSWYYCRTQQLAHHLSHHCLWALLHKLLDLQREKDTQRDKVMRLVGFIELAKSPSPGACSLTDVRVAVHDDKMQGKACRVDVLSPLLWSQHYPMWDAQPPLSLTMLAAFAARNPAPIQTHQGMVPPLACCWYCTGGAGYMGGPGGAAT